MELVAEMISAVTPGVCLITSERARAASKMVCAAAGRIMPASSVRVFMVPLTHNTQRRQISKK